QLFAAHTLLCAILQVVLPIVFARSEAHHWSVGGKVYTGYWIDDDGHIFGPRESGQFWIDDGYIWGPRNSGQFWIQDEYVWGPKDGGKFWIQDGHIYGPDANLPWLD